MNHKALTETLLDMRALAMAASAMVERGDFVDSSENTHITTETMRVLRILSERAMDTVDQIDRQKGGAA